MAKKKRRRRRLSRDRRHRHEQELVGRRVQERRRYRRQVASRPADHRGHEDGHEMPGREGGRLPRPGPTPRSSTRTEPHRPGPGPRTEWPGRAVPLVAAWSRSFLAARSRPSSCSTAPTGARPSNSTAQTSRVMGMSTRELAREPIDLARGVDALGDMAELREGSPPAVRRARAQDRPGGCARDQPAQVRIRSPAPARPMKVSPAPRTTPSRMTSARPRVMSAARAFWPRPSRRRSRSRSPSRS